ncbi:MAG: winged helix DNA-binding domain-containing protein [Candidatus Nanopelagicales bacterium]
MELLTDEQARTLRMNALLLGQPAATAAGLHQRTTTGQSVSTPAQVVEWFGAMQAQDLASGHWSFGVRLPGTTNADIDRATANREVVRTWPMRGTIHFVPPKDAKWMLELTGSIALKGAAKRREFLGLTEADVDLAATVLADALTTEGLLTRAECVELLTAAGLNTAGQHGYHFLWYVSQIGVTVIGPQQGKEQTFALLANWAPKPAAPNRDEALALLAQRYFRSHGPATRKDFAGWTSLSAADAKAAIVNLGDQLTEVQVDTETMYCPTDLLATLPDPKTVPPRVLPGFDEYLLGYKDRTLMADPATMAAVIPGGNGMFRSTVVIDGQVRATWKRTMRSKRIDIAVESLAGWRPTKTMQKTVDQQFAAFGDFLELPVEVAYS